MPRKKDEVAADAAPQAAALPEKVTLEAAFVFWTKSHGADITRQFYANQVVRDPSAIAALIENAAPLKD